VRFQVFATTSMTMIAFLNVGPCILVDIDRRFRGAYRPVGGSTHLLRRRSASTRLHGATSQKPAGEIIWSRECNFFSDSPCFPGDHSFTFVTPFIIL
jgi:hypothetical protein